MMHKSILLRMLTCLFCLVFIPTYSIFAARENTHKAIIIAIDPGHGGQDYGAVGIHKKAEKRITLKIAKQLYNLINHTPGLKAVLTRKGDYFVGLKQRIDISRAQKAQLLVSIHADAATTRKAHGASLYIISTHGKRSAATIWLEQRENRGEFVSGLDLKATKTKLAHVLIDLAQNKSQKQALLLGQSILKSLANITYLHKRTVQKANFIVLKAPDIPSVLIETGFITNKLDAKKLSTTAYQHRLAAAILVGIINYLNNHPPPHSIFA